jgi:transcriptional regulator with XRE-family HTH domain
MREAQVGVAITRTLRHSVEAVQRHSVDSSLRHPVRTGQRHPVTEIRSNLRMETIGDRVKKERELRKISRRELGRACGLAYSTIADLENGYMESTTKLHKIAEYFGLRPQYLETGEPPREAAPAARTGHALTPREEALLARFRQANDSGKRAIEGAARGVTAEPALEAARPARPRKQKQA